MKTEANKLYTRVFWIFTPNSSKSIFIILSYTVSNWYVFFASQCSDSQRL